MKEVRIIYPQIENGVIHPYFQEEAEAMEKIGFVINENAECKTVLRRGFIISKERDYPIDEGIVGSWKTYQKTLNMSGIYPLIAEFTIPTFFCDSLLDKSVEGKIAERGWERIFVKSDRRSLFSLGIESTTWPDSSFSELSENFAKWNLHGPFAIRKFIDNPQIFYDEQRYWVLNGRPHHPSGKCPDFVVEAAKRVFKFSGSHYFTIDVAGDYIVEINPGESSDRGGDNPLDWFCKIFAEAFLYNESNS